MTGGLQITLPPDVLEQIAERAAAIVVERLPSPEPGSPYMTIPEAADYLRAKPQRVYDLLSSGRLTRHKDGSRVLIERAQLAAHVASAVAPSGRDAA